MTFKRRVLSALGKDELLEVGRALELDVTTRMTVDELRDVIAASKRAKLSLIVQESLTRDTLKEICRACGLDDTGRGKAGLVERILAAGDSGAAYKVETEDLTSAAVDGTGTFGSLTGLGSVPTPAKGKPKKAKAPERRRAGVPESEAVVSGSLKAALRQFALGAAGGYRGRDADVSFTTHLLECFGWPAGRPDGAQIPYALRSAEAGQMVDREVALWWPERRTMLAVVPHDAVLDYAWKDLLRACLQHDPPPQYVVFTNQRDLQLYDLARDREEARLAIGLDDLPKYSEAFPFFTTTWVPGQTPRIVNVEKVSAEVADLVAKLYRSVRAQYPDREPDVIRFTLQCITAMFAEDIGLMRKHYFTSLLYDGASNKDLDARLHELFVQMNTKDLPSPRVVPYFNGGLFTDAVSLHLGSEQTVALTKAAEANWTYVDPHIFGSVFQGIMDDAERHASGAHYTAHDDIMRVVGPTIVEPWRKRILAANTLRELTDLRAELIRFRVLDPACGSGNFLYVAYRELYRLDTELLSRMREFRSTHGKLSWNGGILATNFYGIDINPFAVELAKVTLNIAKKIAFEERKAQAYALAGQVELDLDPSLPLDNLDDNIVCKDALLSDWPKVDAIVGNPPILGDRKIRSELGAAYLERLQASSGIEGVVDLSCYWFRRAHDHLPAGGRAGLVATTGIRVGKARAATVEYIVHNGGTHERSLVAPVARRRRSTCPWSTGSKATRTVRSCLSSTMSRCPSQRSRCTSSSKPTRAGRVDSRQINTARPWASSLAVTISWCPVTPPAGTARPTRRRFGRWPREHICSLGSLRASLTTASC
ncbi:MAG: N-6 DNA methylase [Myxococcales bacterium]|nr:N-6 DNA methylase [Myxococcales bacterium]